MATHLDEYKDFDKLGEDQQIPLHQIQVDGTYQRPLNQERIATMTRKYDPALFGRLIVNERQRGLYYVVDGQHRLALAKAVDMLLVPCVVHQGLTVAEEAKLFKELNIGQRKPTWYEMHHASIVGGYPDACAIQQVADSLGVQIAERSLAADGRRIRAVTPLYHIYHDTRCGGAQQVRRVLWLLIQMFADHSGATLVQPHAFEVELMYGLHLFLLKVSSDSAFREERLIQAAQKKTPATLLRDGRAIVELSPVKSKQAAGVAVVLLNIYNAGLRTNRLTEFTTTNVSRKG